MKILSNESLNISYGIEQLEAFEVLDLTTRELKDFILPISIVTLPGYTSNKKVGFHPNFSSLMTSLICSEPDIFIKYVKDYCEEFNYRCELAELIDEQFDVSPVISASTDKIDNLFRFLNSHRQEVKEFISLLKINRPMEIERPLSDISSILDSHLKYYVSYLSVVSMESIEPSISLLFDNKYSGAFNICIGKSLPSNYNRIISSNAANVRLYSLDMAVSKVIKELSKEDASLFSTYKSGQTPISEIVYNSIVYDLIYELINDEWGI